MKLRMNYQLSKGSVKNVDEKKKKPGESGGKIAERLKKKKVLNVLFERAQKYAEKSDTEFGRR